MLLIDQLDSKIMEYPTNVEDSEKYFKKKYLESTNKKVLYIHTPYCPSKCKYCICKSIGERNPEVANDYAVNQLIPQIKKSQDILSSIIFDEVYFGGGTPTYIPAKLLKRVFDSIPNFKLIKKKCIEASPNTITNEHLDLFKEYKFSFISVGIQSLQQDVCKWQNRFYLSKEQLLVMSKILKKSEIYFNYDLICYMGRGDFRDIKGFREDLYFIMEYCKPSSINIHQMHQSTYTLEKMQKLIEILRKAIEDCPHYECINSRLLDSDAYNDIIYQSQYRLVCENRNFSHYMWNKCPEIPVKGYDIYAIGNTDNIFPKSNADSLVYRPGSTKFKEVVFLDAIYDEYISIRLEKGLDI